MHKAVTGCVEAKKILKSYSLVEDIHTIAMLVGGGGEVSVVTERSIM